MADEIVVFSLLDAKKWRVAGARFAKFTVEVDLKHINTLCI
jgi:hypothetical protein